MKIKNRLLNKIMIPIACFSSATAIALSAVITYAAYVAFSQNAFSLDYNADAMVPTYFAAGKGTSAAPYQISTPQQLRNLQKLNALGLFQTKTYFILANDIEWNNDPVPLFPIGNDDQPFFGEFDGRGHTISHLLVNGNETWDVGMFGYVDVNGIVKNFFLSAPTVTVNTTEYGGGADNTNPLHAYLKTVAPNLAAPTPPDKNGNAASTGLSWTNSSNSSVLTGLDSVLIAPVNGENVSFDIEWTSSDTNRLEYSNNAWRTKANYDIDATELTQVMLTGRIYATISGRVCAYTVERYEFNILGGGLITADTVSIATGVGNATTTESRGCFKTIWTPDSNGAGSNYHGIYVGFFIGHLDGRASYLGLIGGNSYDTSANGKIIVSERKALSSTCLFGRSRGDDVRDGTGSTQYGHTFDFTKEVYPDWDAFTAPGTRTPDDIANGRAGRLTKISDYSDLNNKCSTLTGLYGAPKTSDAFKYMRIYPTVTHPKNIGYSYLDDAGNPVNVTGLKAMTFSQGLAGQSYTGPETRNYIWPTEDTNGDGSIDEKDITTSSATTDTMKYYLDSDLSTNDGGISASTGYSQTANGSYLDSGHQYSSGGGWWSSSYTYKIYHYITAFNGTEDQTFADFDPSRYRKNMNLVRGYNVMNGFWVYTKGDNTDVINTIMGNNVFDLTFRITYVASTTNTNKKANSWQVLYNAYNDSVCRFQPCRFYRSSTTSTYIGFIYKDSYLQNVQWYDMHHPKVGSKEKLQSDVYVNGYGSTRDFSDPPNNNTWMPYRDASPAEVGTIYNPDQFPIVADGTLQDTTVTIHVNRKSSWWSAWFD